MSVKLHSFQFEAISTTPYMHHFAIDIQVNYINNTRIFYCKWHDIGDVYNILKNFPYITKVMNLVKLNICHSTSQIRCFFVVQISKMNSYHTLTFENTVLQSYDLNIKLSCFKQQ